MKSSTRSKYSSIFEKVMDRVPDSIKNEIKLKTVREYMPSNSFLVEDTKKFPVKDPGSNDYNPKLVFASYIKAISERDSHLEYQSIAESAIKIFKEIDGHKKINFKIDESFAENDRNILNAIYLLEGKYDKIDHSNDEFDEELPTNKDDLDSDLNHCICTSCGYEDILDIEDESLCEEKICPKCQQKTMIHAEILESESLQIKLHRAKNIEDKMKLVVETTLKENVQSCGSYICDKCKIVIKDFINEQIESTCPSCGNKTHEIDKNHKSFIESNCYCPKCLTLTTWNILETECPICQSNMVKILFPNIKKQNEKNYSIPIES